jgi:general secretion pathway protein D
MKAYIYTLCCVLVTGHITVWAQAPATPSQDAVTESLRREAAKRELRQKLADAQAAQTKGDIYAAARLYDECMALIKYIGTGVESEYAQVVAGTVQTRLILAEQAQRRNEFEQADLHANVILKEDPKNEAALAFKAQNARARAALAGLMPSPETIARLPEAQADRVRASTHVQNGKLLFEAGKLDEAESQLLQAIKIDPSNTAAYTYLNIIREQRHKQENASRESWSKERLLDVDRAWNPPVKRDLVSPNPSLKSNVVYTGKGRQAIYSKLDRIRLDTLTYDGLPLSEVVKSLSEQARLRDPERRGINIIVSANADPPSAPPAPIDPATGLPVATGAAPPEPIDLGSTTIRIVPPLTDITLGQALDAIQRVADRPIKYSVEDYAIVFTPKATETPPLYTRTFKIDPNTFVQGLKGVVGFDFGVSGDQQGGGGGGGGGGRGGGGGGRGGGGGGGGGQQGEQPLGASYLGTFLAPQLGGTGGGGGQGQGQGGPYVPPFQQWVLPGVRHLTVETPTRDYIEVVRQFFLAAGVDLAPPKAIFFNDRLGVLMVRGTLQDLDIIEQAVQMLNMAPPQITIDAKFAEVTQEDSKALGFDWFWGNTLLFGQRAGIQGGTAPSFAGQPSTANPVGAFPGPSVVNGIPPSVTDNLLTTGLRNTVGSAIGGNEVQVPAVATLTGLLTDPQFRLVIRALEQRRGVDLLSAPRITTMSGRQAQVKVVRVETIATGLDLEQTTGGGNQ